MSDRAFLTVRQVAAVLGIRTNGVLSLIRSGELRGVGRYGKCPRLTPSAQKTTLILSVDRPLD